MALPTTSSQKDTVDTATTIEVAKRRGKMIALGRSKILSAKLAASPCAILLTNYATSVIPPEEVKRVDVSEKSTALPVGSPQSCLSS